MGPRQESSPQPSQPPSSRPGGAMGAGGGAVDPADAVESNRSWLNPQDGQVMMARLTELVGTPEEPDWYEFSRDYLKIPEGMPFTQAMQQFMQAQTGNATALDKLGNIAQGANVMPGQGAAAEDTMSRIDGGSAGSAMGAPGAMGPGLDAILSGR